MSDRKPPGEVTINIIDDDLRELPEAIAMRIDREARQSLEAQHRALPMLLRTTVRVAERTFAAIRYLTLDKQRGELPPVTLATAVSPLARTLLDSLFTVVFMFENPADRMSHYLRSGWREATEHHARLTARHGNEPEWTDWLAGYRKWIDAHDSDLGIGVAEKSNPQSVLWFPNPGKMMRKATNPATRDLLGYLNDWFYRSLSADSHLSYIGLANRGGILAGASDAVQESVRHLVFLTAVTLYVALLSEVIVAARLPYETKRVHGMWQQLLPYPSAQELWQKRYEGVL